LTFIDIRDILSLWPEIGVQRSDSMNVSLGETFEKFVAELIASGEYQSQSEVIRDGLRLLKEKQEFKAIRIDELRRQVAIGLDQASRGDVAPLDIAEIKAEGRKRLAAQQRGNKS
jgi:antitoxin ParD1/3/4